MPGNRVRVCPWCDKAFEMSNLQSDTLFDAHVIGCKERNNGVEIWCPFCMTDMYVKVYDVDKAVCRKCKKPLRCKCGKPPKYICKCGRLDCGIHPCPKKCGSFDIAEGLLKGLRPFDL